MDFDAGANLELATQGLHRHIDKVLADWFEREGFVSSNGETNTGSLGGAQLQLVVQGNGLKDGAELVVVVGPLAENVQPEVDFGEGWDSDFAHAAIAAWLLARKIFGRCDAWSGRASFRFQRFCRSRRR